MKGGERGVQKNRGGRRGPGRGGASEAESGFYLSAMGAF